MVEALSTGRPGLGPDCRKQARRVHSSYQRTLKEKPLGSRPVVVRLRVRRYFCDRKRRSRKRFVEQVPGLTHRHGRSSTGLTGWPVQGGLRLVRGGMISSIRSRMSSSIRTSAAAS
ncbi:MULTISPECIES: transposase family protein [unclassified Streptomyces]|uniref:transposase family protein n=1 Tax=unclassified Streptomyces TaxID=2593676 RepID=UPI003802AC92